MKPETLKARLKAVKWHRIETDFKMPFSQGYLINELLKRYFVGEKKPKVLAVGWDLDVVAIKTTRQIMAWKDNGIGARFLGILNYLDGTVEQHPDDTGVKQKKVFNTFRELTKAIEKRNYNNILGLKARITGAEYDHFLNVLPPMKFTGDSFILSEALSDNLYYKFNKDFAEIVKVEDEEIMAFEMGR